MHALAFGYGEMPVDRSLSLTPHVLNTFPFVLQLVDLLNHIYSAWDDMCDHHGLFKVEVSSHTLRSFTGYAPSFSLNMRCAAYCLLLPRPLVMPMWWWVGAQTAATPRKQLCALLAWRWICWSTHSCSLLSKAGAFRSAWACTQATSRQQWLAPRCCT